MRRSPQPLKVAIGAAFRLTPRSDLHTANDVRRSLLGLILCPRCRERLTLDVFCEDAPSEGGERTVSEGRLRCTGCAAAFPVVAGVPRLLAPPLLAQVRARH